MLQTRNIYEQQRFNKWMTVVIMVVFTSFFALVGYSIDSLLLKIPSEELPVPLMTIIAVVVLNICILVIRICLGFRTRPVRCCKIEK